ncbi:hypothetical protein DAI22_12g064300 [Oryza sativa Japonica Group]|nr:hypothetical protein DAI22_12g064300 [Oryza sativa Japonica Group]
MRSYSVRFPYSFLTPSLTDQGRRLTREREGRRRRVHGGPAAELGGAAGRGARRLGATASLRGGAMARRRGWGGRRLVEGKMVAAMGFGAGMGWGEGGGLWGGVIGGGIGRARWLGRVRLSATALRRGGGRSGRRSDWGRRTRRRCLACWCEGGGHGGFGVEERRRCRVYGADDGVTTRRRPGRGQDVGGAAAGRVGAGDGLATARRRGRACGRGMVRGPARRQPRKEVATVRTMVGTALGQRQANGKTERRRSTKLGKGERGREGEVLTFSSLLFFL